MKGPNVGKVCFCVGVWVCAHMCARVFVYFLTRYLVNYLYTFDVVIL